MKCMWHQCDQPAVSIVKMRTDGRPHESAMCAPHAARTELMRSGRTGYSTVVVPASRS